MRIRRVSEITKSRLGFERKTRVSTRQLVYLSLVVHVIYLGWLFSWEFWHTVCSVCTGALTAHAREGTARRATCTPPERMRTDTHGTHETHGMLKLCNNDVFR